MVTVLVLALAAPAYALPTLPPQAQNHQPHKPFNPFNTSMTFHLTGNGTAYSISNRTIHQTASLNLTFTIDRTSPGRARLDVTGGTLTIGSDTFTATSGRGILNVHSHKMILHVSLQDSTGHMRHLILFGQVTGEMPTQIDTGSSFSVNFMKPQSKLAAMWFLEFPGATISRIA